MSLLGNIGIEMGELFQVLCPCGLSMLVVLFSAGLAFRLLDCLKKCRYKSDVVLSG